MKNLGFPALFAAISLSVSVAHAAPLLPGGSVPMFNEPGPVGGTLIASTNVSFAGINFFGNTNFTGTLISQVWSGDAFNPYGGLTFTYRLLNDATSLDALGRLTLSSFAGYQTDVSFNTNVFGIVPFNAARSIVGNQIDFNLLSGPPNFQHNLLPGTTTPVLVIQTDSLVFNIGNASVIDTAVANAVAFVPTTVVPEPATLGLALVGLISVAALRKSRA